ncbi:MAG: 4'-phosphopantetheinyl transferase superfamily protein [Calditrichaeota bacterium]|nr:4'-phosphopantetheinyl transferase superfamily protein [Calditrichota bacterium]
MPVNAICLDTWAEPPSTLDLPPDAVHVWRVLLDVPESVVGIFFRFLSDDERKRAFRFHFDRDRRRFSVARGALRQILGAYLALEPSAIRFGYSDHGKPFLAGPDTGLDLRFNVSHSDDVALVAVTQGREVGIDVEKLRPEFAGLEIAERFFSPAEVDALRSLPLELQSRGFFNCWTRKEAFVKATGKGLSFPLRAFDVTLVPGEAPKLLRVEGDDPSRWTVLEVVPEPGFAGALVVEGDPVVPQGWQWKPELLPARR